MNEQNHGMTEEEKEDWELGAMLRALEPAFQARNQRLAEAAKRNHMVAIYTKNPQRKATPPPQKPLQQQKPVQQVPPVWEPLARKVLAASLFFALGVAAAGFAMLPKTEDSAPPAIAVNLADMETIQTHPLLEGIIPLNHATQTAIYDLCGQNSHLFCAVMAIAQVESGFLPDAVGDNGNSIGMMQINTACQADRAQKLGVTDLTNPVQCAAVAINYLEELETRFEVGPDSEILYIAYNCGPSGAKKLIQSGILSTEYSRTALSAYQGYLETLGAVP